MWVLNPKKNWLVWSVCSRSLDHLYSGYTRNNWQSLLVHSVLEKSLSYIWACIDRQTAWSPPLRFIYFILVDKTSWTFFIRKIPFLHLSMYRQTDGPPALFTLFSGFRNSRERNIFPHNWSSRTRDSKFQSHWQQRPRHMEPGIPADLRGPLHSQRAREYRSVQNWAFIVSSVHL